MSHGRARIDFEDVLVTHADMDGLPTIQALSVDSDFSAGKEPAHGQHFDSSLSAPFLFSVDSYSVIGRYIRKRRPRLDIICVFNKPAGNRGFSCLMLYLPGLFGL